MEQPREEIYERIPWETLEDRGGDKQWLMMGIAAAVVAGALAYSYVSSRPAEPPLAQPEVAATPQSSVPGADDPVAEALPPAALPPAALPPAASPPSNVSEADLYAVSADQLADQAAGHARWFIREFLATETGSESSVLRMLLPSDVPLPVSPEGVAVFVEWVESLSVEEVDLATYRIEVLARYMVSTGEAPYQRMPPEVFVVDVTLADGTPRVLSAPRILPLQLGPASTVALGEVPPAIAGALEGLRPDSEIIGGIALADGSWNVVVMTPGPGGVLRPESLLVPAS